jgi:hypothetical protein
MAFREDVFRGLRLGAIVFAALLVGVAVYRIARETAPAESTEQKPPEPVPAATTTAAPAAVPAPPSRPQIRRHPVGQKTVAAASALPVETEPAAQPVDRVETADVKPEPEPSLEKTEAPAVVDTVNAAAADKKDTRGKRWVKAVGRFLHLSPKKDVEPSAVRQP